MLRFKLICALVALLACVLLGVIASLPREPKVPTLNQHARIIRDKMHWYSGSFAVYSEYEQPVIIIEWSEFGEAQPTTGIVIPNAEASSVFPNLSRLPRKTVVSWMIEGDNTEHRQLIDMAGIVPPNTEGITIFELDAKMTWQVSFEQIADGVSERLSKKKREHEAKSIKQEAAEPPNSMSGH